MVIDLGLINLAFQKDSLPDYITVSIPNLIRILPQIEGPRTEAHFVYPQSLKNVARVQAFRNFLYSKISEWKF